MSKNWEKVVLSPKHSVRDALAVINAEALRVCLVVDQEQRLLGVVTDGDIRRGLSQGFSFLTRPVTELMTKSPKTITQDKLAAEALHLMESNKPRPITVLPVIDAEKHVIGLLHMTDLVRQGVV